MTQDQCPSPTAPALRLDPRGRVLAAVAACVAVAVCRAWPPALAGLAFGGLCLLFSRPSLTALLKRWALVNVFFLGLVLTVPLGVPGEALLSLGPLAYSREGLWAAGLMAAKGNAIFAIFFALVAPLTPAELGAALSALGLPDRLILILALTSRYMAVMQAEWDRLVTAAKTRGFVPGTSRRAYATYGLMLALLLVRAMDRAVFIHQAMLCRGFNGRFPRLDRFAWGRLDTAFCLLAALVVAGVTTLEITRWRP